MITLKLGVFKEKFELDQSICDSFKDRVIFYLRQHDVAPFLVTFVIVDFQKKEFLYIKLNLKENLRKINNKRLQAALRGMGYGDVHSVVKNEKGEDFYAFFVSAGFFYHVNYKKKIARVIFGEDLNHADCRNIIKFGGTHFKDSNDLDFFYFSASEEKAPGEVSRNVYRASFDLKNIEKIYSTFRCVGFSACFHTTMQYKNFILTSFFNDVRFRILATGEISDNLVKLYRHIFRGLFKEYCSFSKKKFYEEDFLKAVKILSARKYVLEKQFEKFIESAYGKGCDFMKICRSNDKYKIEMLPGKIQAYNLKGRSLCEASTTSFASGHFEINEKKNLIYVSSHSLFSLDAVTNFWGPAALDKFSLGKNSLRKMGSFSHPLGYRFASHRAFYFEEKEYLCTSGTPNRLFIISADDMKLVYYKDIGKNYLDKIKRQEMADYANSIARHKSLVRYILSLEVSSDGRFILLIVVNTDEMHFFDMKKREVVSRVNFRKNSCLAGQSLASVHCQYFR